MRTDPLEELLQRLPELGPMADSVRRVFALLQGRLQAGNKLLLCGNGGSAADADHWSGELLKSFRRPRPLSAAQRAGLPAEIAERLERGLPAIPLTSFSAFATAFANDASAELVFAQLTLTLGRPGDVWIGLSTSGNARNVCAAAAVAKASGLATVGLTGASGGQLAGHCDLCLRVPATETYRVQEYHLPIYHCLSLMLEDAFFSPGQP